MSITLLEDNMKNKIECLIAPCTGKTVPLSAVPDEVFANGILG